MRIDAHQHYWQLRRGDYGWLTPAQGTLYRDFMPADLAADCAGCAVTATVLVQAAPSEAETRFLFEIARQSPCVAGVVGWVDFEASDVRRRIERLVRDGAGKLKGLRPMVQDIDDPLWLDRASLDAAFEALIEQGLRFDALVKPQHLDALTRRLRRYPKLQAVLDHCGKPDIAQGTLEPWGGRIDALARGTTACCKLSGLLSEAAAGADIEQLMPFVRRAFDAFGAERILWGSDWPVLTARGTYAYWLQMALECVKRLAPDAEADVFGGNAVRFYDLAVGHC